MKIIKIFIYLHSQTNKQTNKNILNQKNTKLC